MKKILFTRGRWSQPLERGFRRVVAGDVVEVTEAQYERLTRLGVAQPYDPNKPTTTPPPAAAPPVVEETAAPVDTTPEVAKPKRSGNAEAWQAYAQALGIEIVDEHGKHFPKSTLISMVEAFEAKRG